jgi:hypothetical protein
MSHLTLRASSGPPLVWWPVVGWKRKLISLIWTSKYPNQEVAESLGLWKSLGKMSAKQLYSCSLAITCCIELVIVPPQWNVTRPSSTTSSPTRTSLWLVLTTNIAMRRHHPDDCLMRGRERSLVSTLARHIFRLDSEGAILQSVLHPMPSTLAQPTPSLGTSTTISTSSFTA